MCVTNFTDHCEIIFIYQKILKTSINHLRAKKFIYSVIKSHMIRKLFFLLTERENQIQSNTSLLLVTKFAYLVNFNLILRNPFYKS